jgi:hypothetical protein
MLVNGASRHGKPIWTSMLEFSRHRVTVWLGVTPLPHSEIGVRGGDWDPIAMHFLKLKVEYGGERRPRLTSVI